MFHLFNFGFYDLSNPYQKIFVDKWVRPSRNIKFDFTIRNTYICWFKKR